MDNARTNCKRVRSISKPKITKTTPDDQSLKQDIYKAYNAAVVALENTMPAKICRNC
jgi:hypothetical protein